MGWKSGVIGSIVAGALTMSVANAADIVRKAKPVEPPPPAAPLFDIAFGSSLASDYVFRGISQSNRKPSANAYVEGRYNVLSNVQLYAALAGNSISFPNRAAAEVDFYGGIRPTFGIFAFDFGAQYYYYPGGQSFGPLNPLPNGNLVKNDVSFYEVYGKVLATINDQWTVGGGVFYTPNFINFGENADGTYVNGTVKYTVPSAVFPTDWGMYASAEFGHYFLGTTDGFYATGTVFPQGLKLPDYNTWNVGLALTYKVFTLDLRYFDTDLSKGDCNVITSDHTSGGNPGLGSSINPGGLQSSWCGSTFVAKLSIDATVFNNIK